MILALKLFGTLSKNPWQMGCGKVNRICVDSQHTYNRYKKNGVPMSKMRIIGDIATDELYKSCKNKKELRVDIIRKYSLDPSKKIMICAIPQLYEHDRLDIDSHWNEIYFLLESFCRNKNKFLNLFLQTNKVDDECKKKIEINEVDLLDLKKNLEIVNSLNNNISGIFWIAGMTGNSNNEYLNVEDAKKNRSYISHNFESIKQTLKIADLFYESSFSSIKEIPINFRFSILVARRIYRQIGHNILKKKNIESYNNSRKIYVTNACKLIQTFLSLYDLIRLLFIKDENHLRHKEHQIINEEINLNERF